MSGSWHALWSKIKQGKRIQDDDVGSLILERVVLKAPSHKAILWQKPK